MYTFRFRLACADVPTTYPSLVDLTKAVHMCVCVCVSVCLCVHARDFSNCIFPSSTTLLLYMYSTCCESAHPWLHQHDIYTLHVHLLSYCIVVSYICRSGQIFVQGIHKTLAKEPGVRAGRRKDWMVQRGVLWDHFPQVN